MPNKIDLSGRFAVVTGGAQGIGRAITERFLESGASVAIWDRDAAFAQKTAGELKGRGNVVAIAVDVTKLADVERARDHEIRPERREERGDGVEARGRVDRVDVAVEDLARGQTACGIREMTLVDQADALADQAELIGQPDAEQDDERDDVPTALHASPHVMARPRA